jgi:hypothetical protein
MKEYDISLRDYRSIRFKSSWNKDNINSQIKNKEIEVGQSLEQGESLRLPSLQVVIIKTKDSPELLDRFLFHLIEARNHTISDRLLKVGILNDSRDEVNEAAYQRAIAASRNSLGTDIAYLRTAEQTTGSSLLGKIRNEALARMRLEGKSDSEQKQMLYALKLLVTEELRGMSPLDRNPEETSDEHIKNVYAQVGKGPLASNNIASLLSSYLIGEMKVPVDEAIVTHNDDDIIYGSLGTTTDGLPLYENWDFFRERDVLFSDPKTHFVIGKYVGVSGSPLRVLSSAYETVERLLAFTSSNAKDVKSPFYTLDPTTAEFNHLTTEQAIQQLPEIIEHFLSRLPITGFLTSGDAKKEFNPSDLRFDLGSYTMRGNLENKLPTPIGGVAEFIQRGLLKSMLTRNEFKRMVRFEKGSLHLRAVKPEDAQAYKGSDPLESSATSYVHNQVVFERVINTESSSFSEQPQIELDGNTFTFTKELLGKNMPSLKVINDSIVDYIRNKRSDLLVQLEDVQSTYGELHPITVAIKKLLSVTTGERLAQTEQVWEEDIDKKKLTDMEDYVKRIIRAYNYWPFFHSIAYDLGRRNSPNVNSEIKR